MSDDIDRLKGVLEDLRILNDGLTEGRDAMRDIVAAVKPVELETDPEGHGALRTLSDDIRGAYIDARNTFGEIAQTTAELYRKARS